MKGLIILIPIAVCCGLPLLWAAGAYLSKRLGNGPETRVQRETKLDPGDPLRQLPQQIPPEDEPSS